MLFPNGVEEFLGEFYMFPNGVEQITEEPKTLAELRALISRFSLSAKVDDDGVVSVDDMTGGPQYLALAPSELLWLKSNAIEVEHRGSVTKYRMRLK